MRSRALFPVVAIAAVVIAGCSKKEDRPAEIPAQDATAGEAAPLTQPAPDATPKPQTSDTGANGSPSTGKTTELTLPILVEQFPAFYPFSLRLKGVQGQVMLHLAVSELGDVRGADVVSSTVPALTPYAQEAALHWRFQPAKADGRNIAVTELPIPVQFRSEYGSDGMPANSPLANLILLGDTIHRVSADGKYTPANQDPTPLLRLIPAIPDGFESVKELRVKFRFSVSEEGRVENPAIIEPSNTPFDAAALKAIGGWQFIPKLRQGKAVRSTAVLPLVYTPPKK